MRERGVVFKLNSRLTDARPGAVMLKPMSGANASSIERSHQESGAGKAQGRKAEAGNNASSTERSHQEDEEIPAQTLVWTAGTAPNPILKRLPVERDKRGAVIVDSMLAVRNFPGVWALGDCAAVTR
jgi:NADH dehydrogenase FAD-containing subunit